MTIEVSRTVSSKNPSLRRIYLPIFFWLQGKHTFLGEAQLIQGDMAKTAFASFRVLSPGRGFLDADFA
jgi:hypothetical protein